MTERYRNMSWRMTLRVLSRDSAPIPSCSYYVHLCIVLVLSTTSSSTCTNKLFIYLILDLCINQRSSLMHVDNVIRPTTYIVLDTY